MALYKLSKLCFVAFMATIFSLLSETGTADSFYKNTGPYKPAHQQSAVFNFYSHENAAANRSTIFLPVSTGLGAGLPNITENLFGSIVALDDSVTVSKDPLSKEIGRSRGFYVFDSLDPGTEGQAIEFVWTMLFNNGSGFGGSTLTLKGFDRFADPVRELAVVGGTGVFRMARGWASLFTIVFITGGGGDAILAWTIHVYYGV